MLYWPDLHLALPACSGMLCQPELLKLTVCPTLQEHQMKQCEVPSFDLMPPTDYGRLYCRVCLCAQHSCRSTNQAVYIPGSDVVPHPPCSMVE